ncbi:MAG: arginine--tRNA ligase [Nitrospirae bacterium]|nr:arginine--tRNA ligase [Nitrospirota bacterium]
MKQSVTGLIKSILEEAKTNGLLRFETLPLIPIETPKEKSHGDIATSIALALAPREGKRPLEIARIILKGLEGKDIDFEKVEIAGPGFINFTFRKEYWHEILNDILRKGETYGRSELGTGIDVNVEFVSANPTGPLHIGHGRGAALGDALSNLLQTAGYKIQREYYINDTGTQMETLGRSVWIRLLQFHNQNVFLPEGHYQGEYIKGIAREMVTTRRLDEIIKITKVRDFFDLSKMPEEEVIPFFTDYAKESILKGIREDLERFGVRYDRWFSEKSLYDDGKVDSVLSEIKERGFLYERDGALWLETTRFGDDKDRVVRRKTERYTYFASDIAYHNNKFNRGFKRVIDIWGADHHGYVPRMKAVIQALGNAPETLNILLVQLVTLLKEGKPVAMSTRAGEFVTLKEVIDEVGVDAARYIFLTRRHDSHLEFDLEVAKRQSSENPVYYVQYAHARIASLFRETAVKGIILPETVDMGLLNLPEELDLIKDLANYPEVIEGSALSLEPHRITYYLHGLASKLHSYYYKYRIITDNLELTYARLFLMKALGIVIKNALKILGVSAPESM